MKRVLVLTVGFLIACGPAVEPPATTQPDPASTTVASLTSTTEGSQPYEVQDCSAPPVTFTALCDVYRLAQTWHVDRPLNPADLAEVAVRALEGYNTAQTADRPRTLICAIPHEDFTGLCARLAEMVYDSEIPVGPAVDVAVTAMTELGLDPFTYYVPPNQTGSFRSNGVVGGVGILLDATDTVGSKCARITSTCQLQIVFVVEDNPGEGAGLMAGDRIVAVDGTLVDGQGFTATAAAIAGDETGSVEITVERGSDTLSFQIERAELVVPTVVTRTPQPGVGYLRIPDFEADIPELVRDGLSSLAEFRPRTIVVDLRDNPGGFIDSAVEVASEFVDGGVVMESFGPDEHLEYPAALGGLATSQRLVVIVNRGTASAAEVLAGALRDRRNAVIVGSNTFGKDAVQIPFNLRNGGEFHVAVARWATPSGLTAGNGGLTPDRELELIPEMTIEEIVAAALDAAS